MVCQTGSRKPTHVATQDAYRTRALQALCRSVSPTTHLPPSVRNELSLLSLNDMHAKQVAAKDDPLFSWTLCALSELFVRLGIDQGQVGGFKTARTDLRLFSQGVVRRALGPFEADG